MTSTPDQLVVSLVRANPSPRDGTIGLFFAEGAEVPADARAPAPGGKLLKVQRWMPGIVPPQPVILHRQCLNLGRKLRKQLLKAFVPARNHGHSSVSPRANAASASANKASSLPALASSRICLSQASPSESIAPSAASASASAYFSSKVNLGISSRISAKLIMPPRCPARTSFQHQKQPLPQPIFNRKERKERKEQKIPPGPFPCVLCALCG